jgi:hypothetical protein
VASPTLLFEDNSIRWAGAWMEGEGAGRRVFNRFVGYPLDAIGNLGPMEVAAGATECCVLSRAAFIEAGRLRPQLLHARRRRVSISA